MKIPAWSMSPGSSLNLCRKNPAANAFRAASAPSECWKFLTRICEGKGQESDIDTLIELGNQIKDTALCGLGPDGSESGFSTIRYFRDEYEEHINEKHCQAGVCPGLVSAPCQSACPASVDVPGFVSLVGERRYAEALQLHRNRNPFASICGRVCFHICESKCRRATLDKPVVDPRNKAVYGRPGNYGSIA